MVKREILQILRKYEGADFAPDDFKLESRVKKARSGKKEDVERLVSYLEGKYPDQTEDIQYLKESLSSQKETEEIQEVKEVASKQDAAKERLFYPGMEYDINPDENVEIHPAANMMPMMSKQEFWGLVKSIKNGKQEERILTYKGVVVDGRNRLKACKALKIKAKAKEIEANVNIEQLVIDLNANRRHLSTSQKAAGAVLYMENNELSDGKSRDIAGRLFGVSGITVQRAKKVKKINEKLFNKVFNGKIELQEARRKIASSTKKEKKEYSDKDAITCLAEYIPKGNVEKLVDIAEKCSSPLKKLLRAIVIHINQKSAQEKIREMLKQGSSDFVEEVQNECA